MPTPPIGDMPCKCWTLRILFMTRSNSPSLASTRWACRCSPPRRTTRTLERHPCPQQPMLQRPANTVANSFASLQSTPPNEAFTTLFPSSMDFYAGNALMATDAQPLTHGDTKWKTQPSRKHLQQHTLARNVNNAAKAKKKSTDAMIDLGDDDEPSFPLWPSLLCLYLDYSLPYEHSVRDHRSCSVAFLIISLDAGLAHTCPIATLLSQLCDNH